jgi:hypothetical protein
LLASHAVTCSASGEQGESLQVHPLLFLQQFVPVHEPTIAVGSTGLPKKHAHSPPLLEHTQPMQEHSPESVRQQAAGWSFRSSAAQCVEFAFE